MSADPNTYPSGRNVYYVHPLVPRLRRVFRAIAVGGCILVMIAGFVVVHVLNFSIGVSGRVIFFLLASLFPVGLLGWLAVLMLGVMQYRTWSLLAVIFVGGLLAAVMTSNEVPDAVRLVSGISLLMYVPGVAIAIAQYDRPFGEGRIVVRDPDRPSAPHSDC